MFEIHFSIALTESLCSNSMKGILEDINICKIRHPPQYYRHHHLLPNIGELANSIKEKGLLQPVIVRTKQDDGYFEMVAGNRRLEACRSLGSRKISCYMLELDDKQAFEVSLVENIHRKSLSPIEEAYAFRSYVKELGWGGISDLAAKIGKSISYVDKRLKLLDLPPEIIENISSSAISTSVAEELFFIDDPMKQRELARIVCSEKMSSRQTRNLVKEHRDSLDYKANCSTIAVDAADERTQRSFDKSISVFKITVNRLAEIIEQLDDNWIVREMLMKHKAEVSLQIDLLIKEKKKSHKIKPSSLFTG